MAERAGAAVDVDLFVRQAEIAHRRHRHHRKGLVDFEQVDRVFRPAGFSNSVFNAPIGAVGKSLGAAA